MLPSDPQTRKGIPIFSGFISYFPHAIAACAELSRIGNDQHNPGQPLHWAKEKSQDELDALLRHVTDMSIDKVHRDPDGVLAAVKAFWRAGANLERMHDAGINIFAGTAATVAKPKDGRAVVYGVRLSHINQKTLLPYDEDFGPFATREEAEMFRRTEKPYGMITTIVSP